MSDDIWYTMVQDFDGDWWVCPSDKVGQSLMHLKWLYNNRKSSSGYKAEYAPCPEGCYPIGRPDLVEFTRCRSVDRAEEAASQTLASRPQLGVEFLKSKVTSHTVVSRDVLADLERATAKTAAQVRAYHERQDEELNDVEEG